MAIYKKLGLAVAVAGVAVALSGCGTPPVPLTKNFGETSQNKVRAAGHWDALSQDAASQTHDMLLRSGFAADTPVYVAMPANPSSFDAAFRELLITRLTDTGVKVYTDPNQRLQVTYHAHVVKTSGHANVGVYTEEAHPSGSNTEVILTTSVTHNGQYVARKTDVYYLANADVPLFAKPNHMRPVNVKVVGQ
ncbi:hypothetical protein [Diaphorobacter aerolatus]|uniref:FlgO domain-containing protein n=1 Tax=Diaphorobacter aerolatus TaxID=1288495 RepID=A0A7H0GGR0_9BURK|nr:hypothetical protein [Diaphorobacter aerolatus]QNP47476.1 hypothetical protein H9K75_14475 [Diaphorobacter aerolatus]